MSESFEELKRLRSVADDDDYDEDDEADHIAKMGMREAITFVGQDPTTKIYLILLTMYEDEESEDGYDETRICREWRLSTGRQYTYDWLKNIIEAGGIDVHKSFILSGETAPENAITVYRFMKTCIESNKVRGGDFDIDDGNDSVLPADDLKIEDIS